MNVKHARVRLFYFFLHPVSTYCRKKRMQKFRDTFRINKSTTILDLGGQPPIWDSMSDPLDIVILNLPGIAQISYQTHHNIKFVEGDACNVAEMNHKSFDIVFSNSVIEHVGDAELRARFTGEVRRLGKAYWVQTPSRYFPIEPHNGMPLWWFWPQRLRRAMLRRWKRTLPEWTEMVEGTDIISKEEMLRLFPEAEIYVERVWGFPKSYTAFSVG